MWSFSFEIFDDVAFYYMATSVISMFLFPLLFYKAYEVVLYLRSRSAASADPSTSYALLAPAKKKLLRPPPRPSFYSLLTFSNISLLLLILTFVFLLAQLSSYNAKPLTSYDPFQVLGLTSSATPAEIKRAYRSLSLRWHPDKNVDNAEEANRQFIAITKAYASLTSETARENIERYGNPDGPQAMSVSIGLPSFLTKRENEMRVLLLYFLIFLVLPPCRCVHVVEAREGLPRQRGDGGDAEVLQRIHSGELRPALPHRNPRRLPRERKGLSPSPVLPPPVQRRLPPPLLGGKGLHGEAEIL